MGYADTVPAAELAADLSASMSGGVARTGLICERSVCDSVIGSVGNGRMVPVMSADKDVSLGPLYSVLTGPGSPPNR